MPRICAFYGIVILMFHNEGAHQVPHFHAQYGDFAASIGLDGALIAGDLPARTLRIVREWADLHRDELAANWARAMAREPLQKIAPLS